MNGMTIGKFVAPSSLAGQPNGAVDSRLLAQVDQRTGLSWLMLTVVARSMRAMHVAAKQAEFHLTSTGRGRTLAGQWDIFGGARKRYEPCTYAEYLVAKPFGRAKQWPDAERHLVARLLRITIPEARYWRKIKQANGGYLATAAVPGTSNHGWWGADDMAENIGGVLKPLSRGALQWLYDNAPSFGFRWELKSETWHLVWFGGNSVTRRTLDIETPAPDAPIPGPALPPHEQLALIAAAIARAKTTVLRIGYGGKDATPAEREAVFWMQAGINANYDGPDLAADGAFGPATDRALRAYQIAEGLKVDGICGKQTWARLYP